MGFCDYVTVEKECGTFRGGRCQTKTLCQTGGEYTISRDGRLLEQLFRVADDPERASFQRLPLSRRIPAGERVIDYHGDILLCSDGDSGAVLELVARFTHGRLEWLRPLEDYPEANRSLLVEQGVR